MFRLLFPPTRHLVPCALALVAIAATPLTARADISAADASMIVQSTATDADFALLTSLVGSQIGQSVNYSSTSDASSWAGSLSGTYLGTGLSLASLHRQSFRLPLHRCGDLVGHWQLWNGNLGGDRQCNNRQYLGDRFSADILRFDCPGRQFHGID